MDFTCADIAVRHFLVFDYVSESRNYVDIKRIYPNHGNLLITVIYPNHENISITVIYQNHEDYIWLDFMWSIQVSCGLEIFTAILMFIIFCGIL